MQPTQRSRKINTRTKHLQLIPVEYHSQILCHFSSKNRLKVDEQVWADCVICTTAGFLIEFLNKRVVGCVELSNINAQKVVPFIVFEDKDRILYVVQLEGNVLEIIARDPHLRRERLETNVIEWKIEYDKFGVPQVRVKKQGEAWQSLSFTEQTGGLSAGLQDMGVPLELTLENLQWKLEKSRALLAEKQQVRSRVLASLCAEQRCSAINVTAAEYVVHHGNLVIAVAIEHVGREPVSDVHLVVSSKHSVKLHQRGRENLAQGDEAFILGSVTCCDVSSALHTNLVYNLCGTQRCISLPPHTITPQTVLQFQVQNLQAPLCEVLLHCSQVTLILQLHCILQMLEFAWQNLMSALSCEFTLVRESRVTSVWTSCGAQLGESYMIVTPAKHTIALCCSTDAQLGVLRLVLQGNLPQGCKLLPWEDKDPDSGVTTSSTDALRHELQWISQHSRFALTPMTVQEYQAFYQELTKRSCVTDASFNYQ